MAVGFYSTEYVTPPESMEVLTRDWTNTFSRKGYYQSGKWFDGYHRPIRVNKWKHISRPEVYNHLVARQHISRIIAGVLSNEKT